MKKFLKNLFKFAIMSILALCCILISNGGYRDFFEKSVFNKKLELFNQFIEDRQSINLILGSSIVQHAINPESLGRDWFNFATGAQNIYESYIFLNYYKEKIQIDTILISLKPFDFPYSYTKNRKSDIQIISGEFSIFSSDSITSFYGSPKLRFFQNFKEKNFKGIGKFLFKRNTNNDENLIRIYNNQGFSPIINQRPANLDSIYATLPFGEFKGKHYYHNVRSNPNMKYFWLFDSLAKSISKQVIYTKTPRSKYYRIGEIHQGYDKFWGIIASELKLHSKIFWDFSKINKMKFVDDTHIDFESSKIFTNIVKNKLKLGFNNFRY